MNKAALAEINQAVQVAYQVAQSDMSVCDASDVEELIEPIKRELHSPHPNELTLSTYLNSLARSLRTDPAAREACDRLDSAMRAAGIQAHWAESSR